MPGAKKKRLKTLSRTRWVEQHDVLEIFIDLYSAIIEALLGKIHGDANCLLTATEKFSFLLPLIITFNVLSYVKGVTLLLYTGPYAGF